MNAQGLPNSASGVARIVLLASAAFLSNNSSTALSVGSDSHLGGGAPGGAMSSSSSFSAFTPQPGNSAHSVASRPNGMDFSCGFHENLASGTRSRVLRVAAISSSNSRSSDCAIVMDFAPPLGLVGHRKDVLALYARYASPNRISNSRSSYSLRNTIHAGATRPKTQVTNNVDCNHKPAASNQASVANTMGFRVRIAECTDATLSRRRGGTIRSIAITG